MFIHLGNDILVSDHDIVAVLDIEKATTTESTKDFLRLAAVNKRVMSCTDEIPRSMIITLDKDLTETVYISRISPQTIKKRVKLSTKCKF